MYAPEVDDSNLMDAAAAAAAANDVEGGAGGGSDGNLQDSKQRVHRSLPRVKAILDDETVRLDLRSSFLGGVARSVSCLPPRVGQRSRF